MVFGPPNEIDLQSGTNQFLDLDKRQLLTNSGDFTSLFTGDWLNQSGADLIYAGEEKLLGLGGVFSVAPTNGPTNLDDWDNTTADHVQAQMDSTSPVPGGRAVNLLTRDQSAIWFFKTREGAEGILQLVSFTNDPAAAKIRYKLIQGNNRITAPPQISNTSDETLADRLQAATMMNDFTSKDSALGKLAADAAKAGNAKVAGEALQKMFDSTARSQAALEAVRALAKRGMRKPAIEIAKTIPDFNIRDQALSELAQQ